MSSYIKGVMVLVALRLSAADLYVRDGGTSAACTTWADACDQITTAENLIARGSTIWVADGNYDAVTFNTAVSGTSLITVKKATVADHGTETGWEASYGDGQAVIATSIAFSTSYYLFTGNGSHTIPSSVSSDYGFKVVTANTLQGTGIVQIGTAGAVPEYITVAYTHIQSPCNGQSDCNTVSVRFYPGSQVQQYVKLLNNFLDQSGKDGIQISSSAYILVERNYLKQLGKALDGPNSAHGQTVQLFYGGHDIVFRWNVWESCGGQALLSYDSTDHTDVNMRFYGNVVFSAYGHTYPSADSEGFNVSGGLVGDAWNSGTLSDVFIYNNTVVNQSDDYVTQVWSYSYHTYADIMAAAGTITNLIAVNNLYYNSNASHGPNTACIGCTDHSYNASGGGAAAQGTNEQTGLASSIFSNYTGNDFRLAAATNAGKTVSGEAWWSGGADGFFGTVDSVVDMYGATRGADGVWDRGAYEYAGTPPSGPSQRSAGKTTAAGKVQ